MNCFNIIILGQTKVGKSTLVRSILGNDFDDDYEATIIDSFRKVMRIKDQQVIFTFIDTGGDLEYVKVRDEEIKKADGCILVYDLTKPNETLEPLFELRDELQHVHKHKHHHKIEYVLVGMKSDLSIAVTGKQKEKLCKARRLASSFVCPYFELNPFNKRKINELFEKITMLVFNKESKRKSDAEQILPMNTPIMSSGTTHADAMELHNKKWHRFSKCIVM